MREKTQFANSVGRMPLWSSQVLMLAIGAATPSPERLTSTKYIQNSNVLTGADRVEAWVSHLGRTHHR